MARTQHVPSAEGMLQVSGEMTVKGAEGAPNTKVGTAFPLYVGTDLDAAAAHYGHKVVFDYYLAGLVIASRGPALNMAKAGKSPEEIAQFMSTWKPTDKVARAPKVQVDPSVAFFERFQSMSKEERLEQLKKLQALAKSM